MASQCLLAEIHLENGPVGIDAPKVLVSVDLSGEHLQKCIVLMDWRRQSVTNRIIVDCRPLGLFCRP